MLDSLLSHSPSISTSSSARSLSSRVIESPSNSLSRGRFRMIVNLYRVAPLLSSGFRAFCRVDGLSPMSRDCS